MTTPDDKKKLGNSATGTSRAVTPAGQSTPNPSASPGAPNNTPAATKALPGVAQPTQPPAPPAASTTQSPSGPGRFSRFFSAVGAKLGGVKPSAKTAFNVAAWGTTLVVIYNAYKPNEVKTSVEAPLPPVAEVSDAERDRRMKLFKEQEALLKAGAYASNKAAPVDPKAKALADRAAQTTQSAIASEAAPSIKQGGGLKIPYTDIQIPINDGGRAVVVIGGVMGLLSRFLNKKFGMGFADLAYGRKPGDEALAAHVSSVAAGTKAILNKKGILTDDVAAQIKADAAAASPSHQFLPLVRPGQTQKGVLFGVPVPKPEDPSFITFPSEIGKIHKSGAVFDPQKYIQNPKKTNGGNTPS